MAAAKQSPSTLDEELAALPSLDLATLRRRWIKLYGTPAPLTFRRDLLIRAIAYQMQVKVHGGLSAAIKRQLREIAAAARDGSLDGSNLGPRIRPGTRLVRIWQGTTHTVFVHDGHFEWNGERYRSLSTIAKAITGTSWNGWTFFGIKRPPARNKNAAGRAAKRELAHAAVKEHGVASA